MPTVKWGWARSASLAFTAALFANLCFAQPFVSFSHGQVVEGGEFTVYITDEISSELGAPVAAEVTKAGSIYKICLHRVLTGVGDQVIDTQRIPLSPIPAGQYAIDYLESNSAAGEFAAPCKEKLFRTFIVVPSNVTTALVEYYNADLDHYFMTADEYEERALDTGVIAGWARTGIVTIVYVPDAPASEDLSPVCRFYGLPHAGINSHFYSATGSDCHYVLTHWPESWELESLNAFKVVPLLPNGVGCPANTLQVIRVYNNKPDVNHRYTIFPSVAANMKAQGWIVEGPVWCAAVAR